jgi:hypothetical protein
MGADHRAIGGSHGSRLEIERRRWRTVTILLPTLKVFKFPKVF